MKKSLIFLTLFSAFLTLNAGSVFADSGVYGQYGQYGSPSPSLSILIDKKVSTPNPATTKGGAVSYNYVDNLTPADPRFKPGAAVMFQLRVKNTSTVTLNDVIVKDFVPSYLEPIEGFGSWDASSRMISMNAGTFAPGEEKIYYVKMQLYGQAQLPADKGLFCLTNRAQAANNNVSDEDTAQFCVEKEVVGATEAPKAGPEAGLLILGANTVLAGLGISLKKLTRKDN